MKKILFPLILVLAIFLAGAPFIVGLKVQSEADNALSQINDNTAYKAEWSSYSTGWLSSRGTLSVGLAMAELENINLNFDVEINHGPFLKENGLGWAEWNVKLQKADELREFIEWEAGTPLYEISGALGFAGSIQYKDAIPVLKSNANSEVSFAFGGYIGTGETANGTFI